MSADSFLAGVFPAAAVAVSEDDKNATSAPSGQQVKLQGVGYNQLVTACF
jgi:hypothetical protein